ncbi:tumor necrosis factor receptor superfamily member wengen [Lycorma delicatula]|uniref:tumor necrosis factor receptor superfamily member wengen n=1 Tax=Lycorma delicatula TaxID=130591 RepID=UPI003F514B5D
MGISYIKLGLLVGAFVLPLSVQANKCQFGKQYRSSETGTCVDCTRCRSRNYEVVIRPCQVHADTICGPISALKLEWPGIKQQDHLNENDQIRKHHKNTHIHHHHHHIHDLAFHDLPEHKLDKDPYNNVEEWERLLKQSRAQLQHRKEDLMKSLLERKNAAKHNHNKDWEDEELDEISTEHYHRLQDILTTHRPHISKLDLEIFEKLINNEHKNRNKRPLEPLSLIDERLEEENNRNHFDKSDSKDDFPELYDFMAVVPNHRLFLGEPSTVPEMMMDQTREQSVSSERVPFTATETFVWDWQAVALISAIIACLLFFALAAIYSILHARQWRRIKNHFNVDVEDLALRVSLMHNGGLNSSSSSDVSNTNHYLEQLIAEKKLGENKSNIYIEKQPS